MVELQWLVAGASPGIPDPVWSFLGDDLPMDSIGRLGDDEPRVVTIVIQPRLTSGAC